MEDAARRSAACVNAKIDLGAEDHQAGSAWASTAMSVTPWHDSGADAPLTDATQGGINARTDALAARLVIYVLDNSFRSLCRAAATRRFLQTSAVAACWERAPMIFDTFVGHATETEGRANGGREFTVVVERADACQAPRLLPNIPRGVRTALASAIYGSGSGVRTLPPPTELSTPLLRHVSDV